MIYYWINKSVQWKRFHKNLFLRVKKLSNVWVNTICHDFVTVHKLNKYVLNIHPIKVIDKFKCLLAKFISNAWILNISIMDKASNNESRFPQSSYCKIYKVFHLEGFAAWNIFLSPQVMVVPHSEIMPLYVWWFVEADIIRNVRFEQKSCKDDKFVIYSRWCFFYRHLNLLQIDSDLKYIICSELYISLSLHL
jgi:hypothetical protein